MMPSYCITLQGEGSRWELFHKRALGVQGLKVARFPAVDCRDQRYQRWACVIDPSAYKELYEVRQSGERQRHDQLTPGAVGCYLSHLAVLRKAYAQAHPRALIFEDDAVPPPNLMELLALQMDQLERRAPNWDMLLLGYLSPQRPLLPFAQQLDRFYRTHAYVVSDRGMAKILALAHPLRKQYDSALSDWAESKRLEIYGAVPQLVLPDESLPTTIQLPVQPQQTLPPKRQAQAQRKATPRPRPDYKK